MQNTEKSGRSVVPIRPVPQRVTPVTYQRNVPLNPAILQNENFGLYGGFANHLSVSNVENMSSSLNTLAQLINAQNIKNEMPPMTLQKIYENLHKKGNQFL